MGGDMRRRSWAPGLGLEASKLSRNSEIQGDAEAHAARSEIGDGNFARIENYGTYLVSSEIPELALFSKVEIIANRRELSKIQPVQVSPCPYARGKLDFYRSRGLLKIGKNSPSPRSSCEKFNLIF
jgi:hypothetical protein